MENQKNNNKPKLGKQAILTIIGMVFLLAGIVAFYFINGPLGAKPIYGFLMGGIALAIIIIGIIFVVLVKKGKIPQDRDPDYRLFFILGITWLPLGVATDNYAFTAMGAVFMIIGLANKNKWKKWPALSEIPEAQRKFKLITVTLLGIFVLLALIAWFLFSR